MALPLNVFKTIPLSVPLIGTEVYRAPIGYNAIILLAQINNEDEVNTHTVNFSYNQNSVGTSMVKNYEVPPKEVLTVSGGNAGRLIVMEGDKLILSGSSSNLKFLMSLIETLK
jgi:hypothetical protein